MKFGKLKVERIAPPPAVGLSCPLCCEHQHGSQIKEAGIAFPITAIPANLRDICDVAQSHCRALAQKTAGFHVISLYVQVLFIGELDVVMCENLR